MNIEHYFDDQKKLGWKKTHVYGIQETPYTFNEKRCKGDFSDFPTNLEFDHYVESFHRRLLVPIFKQVSL